MNASARPVPRTWLAGGVLAGALSLGGLVGLAVAAPKDPAPPRPDARFYAREVAPVLARRCASCHRSGGGALALPTAGDAKASAEAREAEFAAVVRFVNPEAPWDSRLLTKALGEEDGGLPHAGGAALARADDDYDTLLDFACGATPENLPPEPEAGKDRRIALGEEIALDGSLSYDRDGDELRHEWALFARPPGSAAALKGEREPVARFTPDAEGTYVARLRVTDGKVWSAWRVLVLEALDGAGPSAPDAVAASGLADVPPEALALVRSVYGDVLGRPPTPPEAVAAARRDASAVAAALLATLEAGRAFVEDAAFRLGLVGDAEPRSAAVSDLPARMSAGGVSPAAAEAVLARDPAFLRAHRADLAAATFGLLLSREPTPAERDAVRAAVAGRPTPLLGRERVTSAADVVEAALASPEHARAALARYAARFLPEAPARAVPPERAAVGTRALAAEWIASPPYAGRAQGRRAGEDPAFVRAVFADLLGRRPTSSELYAATRACAVVPGSSAGRAVVVAVLLDSGEVPLPLLVDLPDPDAWLADRFLRFLGRLPAEAERAVYRQALLDPAGGPHLVVRALLRSPEYAAR